MERQPSQTKASALQTIPNYLSIIRMLATPPLVWYAWNHYHDSSQLTVGLFFLTVIATDFIDGYLARRLHQVSNLGAVLDRGIDKILSFACFGFILALYHHLGGTAQSFWIMVALVTIRCVQDIQSLVGSRNGSYPLSSNFYGKIKFWWDLGGIAWAYYWVSGVMPTPQMLNVGASGFCLCLILAAAHAQYSLHLKKQTQESAGYDRGLLTLVS